MRFSSQLTLLITLAVCTIASVSAEQVLEIKQGMTVYGSSELPKGLAIVPWKTQLPDVAIKAIQPTVADEIFQPIDRVVFRRQLGYYRQLFPLATATK